MQIKDAQKIAGHNGLHRTRKFCTVERPRERSSRSGKRRHMNR